jgi:hypothetical protein
MRNSRSLPALYGKVTISLPKTNRDPSKAEAKLESSKMAKISENKAPHRHRKWRKQKKL